MEAGLYIPPRLAACMTASPCESGDLRPVRTHGDESRITQGLRTETDTPLMDSGAPIHT